MNESTTRTRIERERILLNKIEARDEVIAFYCELTTDRDKRIAILERREQKVLTVAYLIGVVVGIVSSFLFF